MPPTKQARDCRVGDILIYKNEDSRIITNLDHRGKTCLICTTDLTRVLPRFDAPDSVKIRGTQEALF